MPTKTHPFPWGIYIGDLIDNNDTIPLCLDSKQGGFCLLFDEDSEEVANNFIENIALKLLEVMRIDSIEVDIFDFGKPRFKKLSVLKKANLYNVFSLKSKASDRFDILEELQNERLHTLYSGEVSTLSEYNELNQASEIYQLLLINLDDFPDEIIPYKNIKNFFDSLYEAGFYVIAFGNENIIDSKSKATQTILKRLSSINIINSQFKFDKELFEFSELLEEYEFEYVNDNKDKIVKNLLDQLEKEDNSSIEKDFLSVPIGTSKNGRDVIYFKLGSKSKNYHAFIAGRSGSGKTTLLNNIIVGIADNYTSNEIELHLIDYKGSDFKIYKNHPNCRKLFLNTKNIDNSISILEEFNDELYIRKKKFEIDDSINNIDKYNTLIPNKKLTRKILIIDEVQNLFKKSYKDNDRFSELLIDILREGRAYGLHIILATQHLKDINMKSSIMEGLDVRIALQMSESVASKILNYDNTKVIKELKNKDSLMFVYNNYLGMSGNNLVGNIIYLKEDNIQPIIIERINQLDKNIILKPIIVMSEESVKEEVEIKEKPKTKKSDFEPKHSTDSAKELLERLAKMKRGNDE